jgi:hypothetical protein
VKDRSIVRTAAGRRQRTSAPAQRNQREREPAAQHEGDDRCGGNARVGDRDDDHCRNHSEATDALDPYVRHVDERGRWSSKTPGNEGRWGATPVARKHERKHKTAEDTKEQKAKQRFHGRLL